MRNNPPAYEIKATVWVMGEEDGQQMETEGEEGVIWLYADGSGLEGNVGAAAAMYKQGQEAKVLCYHLGALTDHTVFKVEAVGILLALHLLQFEQDVTKAIIQIDNQAVLGTLAICKVKPAQNIIDKIISQVENTWGWAGNPGFQLELGWVKGHSGVEGNEWVDWEAKEATKGRSSWMCSLPSYLTEKDLLKSIMAQRQMYDASFMEDGRRIGRPPHGMGASPR